MKLLRRAPAAALLLLLGTGAAYAQGEDARVLPRGYVGVRVAGEYTHFDARLGSGSEAGALGAPFATPFPASLFSALRPVGDTLGLFFARTGRPGETFALAPEDLLPGALDLGLAADVRRIPISLEAGIARRLNLRVTVPIERRETELTGLRIAGGAIGTRGSLSAAQRDSLSRMLGAIDPALRAVARQPYLPLADSRLGQAMQERYRRATGDQTRLPLPTRGLFAGDLNDLLETEELDTLAFGSSYEEYGLGDIEAAAKLQVLGDPSGALSPGLTGSRLAVEAVVRLPTAVRTGPDSLLQVATDAGHAGATAALFADLALTRRVWVGTYARYAALLSRDVERHALLPAPPFPRLGEIRTVSRDPGDRMEITVAPHLQVTDELAVSGRYAFARIGETVYGGGTDGEGAAPAGLESLAARSAQSLGFGMSYSTLGAFAQGRAGIPLEVWLTYENAFAGSGGAEDARTVRVAGRLFYQLWARRRAAQPSPPPATPAPARPPTAGEGGTASVDRR